MSIHAIKGTRDLLPEDVREWTRLESVARKVFARYGFKEIRTPIFESTDLFCRSIGEGTDIVQKEMYTFLDPKKRSITLRPEGTASVVRAFLEHSLASQGNLHKLFYMGPMFRYERPQTGRMRQFHQIGVEAFGSASPGMDAEVIVLMVRFLEALGIQGTQVKLNSLGARETRPAYLKDLRIFVEGCQEQMCGDCQVRISTNLLRVLDCKRPECQSLLAKAPSIADFLSDDCRAHFQEVCALLDAADVSYVVEPRLVRGLDYYTRTVFEVSCSALGAQDAIGAGGRYDNLVADMGGASTPAVGFAFGMERLLLARQSFVASAEMERSGLFIVALGAEALHKAFAWTQTLRLNGVKVEMDYDGRSVKSQMRYADKAQFKWVLVVGDHELQAGQAELKNLADGSVRPVNLDLNGLVDLVD